MSKILTGITLAFAVAVVAALPITASTAQAATAAGAAKTAPAVGADLLQNIHFCHRRSRIGPVTGLRHRHVGPGCRWVRTSGYRNRCRRWRRICRRRCYDRRNPRRCFRRCYNRNAPDRCF
ncbi:MAG: hypothetical protein AAGC70_11935 [Pseudomonadota bacterium]